MSLSISDFRNAPAVYKAYNYGLENCVPIVSVLLKDAWACRGVIPIVYRSHAMVKGVREMISGYGELHHTLSLQELKGGKVSENEICCALPPTDGSSNPTLLACESSDYPNGRPWCDAKDLARVLKEHDEL